MEPYLEDLSTWWNFSFSLSILFGRACISSERLLRMSYFEIGLCSHHQFSRLPINEVFRRQRLAENRYRTSCSVRDTEAKMTSSNSNLWLRIWSRKPVFTLKAWIECLFLAFPTSCCLYCLYQILWGPKAHPWSTRTLSQHQKGDV